MASQQNAAQVEHADVVRRQGQNHHFQPATDIVETADAVILKFDMPGVAKESVEITIDKDTLIVVGTAEPEEAGNAIYRETYVGDYRRQFTLGADINRDRVAAQMHNGVLTVTIGKAEQAKPRRIEITTAQ